MKRILSIVAAGCLALLAFSCVSEEDKAIFDVSKATPPVLLSVEVGDNVVAQYTPAVFNMTFNEKMKTYHSLAVVSIQGEEANVTLTTKNEGNTLSVTGKSLTNFLKARGFKTNDNVALEIVVRGSIQDPSRGITNGYIDSKEKYPFSWTMPEEVVGGCPYEDYVEDSSWSLIGALSAYDISWDGDLNMWTDGTNHVAAHVILKAGDECKFRKDQGWGENFGGDFGGIDEEFAVSQDGPNIKVTTDGVYDLYLNPANGTAWITYAYDPYPDYNEASAWSVIGAIAAYENEWNKDLAMVSDGTSHAAFAVTIGADDEFKFRKDAAWTENLGGEFGGIDAEFAVSQDGPNIKVGAAGVYDLFVNPDALTATVAAASGLKVSTKIGGSTPEPPAPTGWGILGDFNGWGNDVAMTEAEGVWTGYFTNADKEDGSHGAFKVRKDADWAENYGAPGEEEPVEVTLGEAMPVVAGGKNFSSPAGLYKVVLNLSDESNPTLTVSAGDAYSLIGVINGTSWDTDFEMEGADGVYTSPVVYISGGFKIRHNFSWDDENTYGADGDVTVGVAFTAAQPGSDISIPAGNYKVQFTPATKEVLISSVEYELPEIDLSAYEVLDIMAGAETWGIIGPAVSDWSTDVDLQKIQDDPEVWAAMNVPFQAGEFKFRGNDDWGDYDLGGGEFALDTPIVLTKGGGNLTAERGVYTVYLYPTYGVAYMTNGSGDVPPPPEKPSVWSLIGTLNGTEWDTDFDMENTSGDIWKITNVTVDEKDEFKIRANHNWDGENYGGPEENEVSIIDASNPYYVYRPTLGEAFEAGSKNIHIGVPGSYNVTFDYAAKTILIEEYKEYPDHLYMIGDAIGGWDWGADYIVEMNPVVNVPEWGADNPGQFYSVLWLPAGKGFKFCSQKAWSGDFWGLENNDGFTENGGNCEVAEDGFYLIHIDIKKSIVHVEPARVFGIGPCFGGWTEEVEGNLFQADGKTLKATLQAGGNPRVYVASSIAPAGSWWQREFTILDGKIAYRVRDEYSWPSAEKGQVMTFNFNEGTGSISGEGQEEGWSLIGFHSADVWTTNVEMTPVAGFDGWIVAQHIGAASSNIDFKFRIGGEWAPNIGAEYNTPKDLNVKIHCHLRATYDDPDTYNIHLNGNGLYDVYLNPDELICVILESGTPFAIPAEWEQDPSQIKDVWSIIGDACEKGWGEDSATFEEEEGDYFVARNVSIAAAPASFKFRANHTWGKELTGAAEVPVDEAFPLVDGTGGAANTTIAVGGTFDVYLAKDLKTCILKTVGGGGTEANITIDGNYDDWADVPGAEPADAFKAFKVTNDADNFYFYVETDPGSRLWTGGGYLYLYFDWDNDLTTGAYSGATGMKGHNYEAYTFMFIFEDNKISAPTANSEAHGMTLDNLMIAGSDSSAEIVKFEISIPRANFEQKVNAGDVIGINSYRSKDGGNVYYPGYVVK